MMVPFGTAAIFLAAYPYAFFPLILEAATVLRGRRAEDDGAAGSAGPWEPRVSILLSAFNEEAVIAEKIGNVLALEYPRDKIELLVVSDGSTDRTDAILGEASARHPGTIRFFRSERQGKTAALNRMAREACGDVLVFTDANAFFRPDAVGELVRPLADAGVGLVSGRTAYRAPGGARPRRVLGLFERLELSIRAAESAAGRLVSADGAIYALRRSIYEPLDNDRINDLYHPFQTVLAGYRSVFNARAVCDEEQPPDWLDELKRQRRICAQSFFLMNRILPAALRARKPGFAFLLASHKYLRLFSFPLGVLGAVLLAWAASGAAAVALAAAGLLFARGCHRGKPPFMETPAVGALVRQGAILCEFFLGVVDGISGKRKVVWNVRGDQ